MAMTEARPEAETPHPASEPVGAISAPLAESPVATFFGTARDNAIGRLWIGTALVFLAMTGVLGGLLGAERIKPETYNVFSNDSYGQALSLHGVSGLFLVAIPLIIGVATAVVPRQVGAATIAFPRAAALAYWGYLGGGVLVVVSYLINGGPFGGNDRGVDLFFASLGMVAVSLGLALLCIAVTVIGLRVPGLYLERTPLFSWSMLVAATVWIAGLGLLVGTLTLLYLDHRYRAFNFAESNDIDAWLRWTMTQPQIYAAAIPVLGFVADAIATATRARPPQRHLFGTIGAFSILTFGAWTFLYFAHPDMRHQFIYMGMGIAILVPLLLYTAGIAGMFLSGHARFTSPLLFALTALLLLWGGVATGAVRVIHRLTLLDTTADSSVAHFVLGAALVAAIGAIHYWWPQVLGTPMREGVARLTAVLLLLGVGALASVDLVSGLLDEPRGSAYTDVRDGVQALNTVSLVGGVLVAIAVVVFVINLAVSLVKRSNGDDVDAVDPWEGQTLEWAADPGAITVESGSPLLDRREAGSPVAAGAR